MSERNTASKLGRSLERVDTVFLPVPDFDAAIEWYTDVIGLSLRWRDDDGGYAAIDVDPAEEATDVRFFEFRDPFGNALGVCSF